jgi:prevent-host-death family protein
MQVVPIYHAKNHLSELIAAVESGEEVSITRRGVPVAQLVACKRESDEAASAHQRERVVQLFERLRLLRAHTSLGGDIKGIAREGLD